MAKGRKTGGRKKGSSNLTALREKARKGDFDALDGIEEIAKRRVSCGTCVDETLKPTGRTRYKLAEGRHAKDCDIFGKNNRSPVCTCQGYGTRICESCFGTLWERISVDTMLRALAELASYQHAKLKAIEHTGPEGGPIQVGIRVRFVKALGAPEDGRR